MEADLVDGPVGLTARVGEVADFSRDLARMAVPRWRGGSTVENGSF